MSPASLVAEGLVPGFADPVHDAQASFRLLLEAMAHPGRVLSLGIDLAAAPPAPLDAAAAAVMLALLDRETPLWLGADAGAAAGYLRFHCGCPVTDDPGAAGFAFLPLGSVPPPLARFDLGSDDYPDRSTTLIIAVRGLAPGPGIGLMGPGIEGRAELAVEGLPPGFWAERQALECRFPRGLDVTFTAGSRLAALPRSTRVEG
jgi:alpha-D-ribose 1-methylphosphonate 5-triphosphate synthase subunit PhnH